MKANLQRFTTDLQARKLILESGSRLTNHLTLMLMTTLVMHQKQNTFQFCKTVLMRAIVKETLPKVTWSNKKIIIDLCKIPMRTYLAKFLAPRHMLCQFSNGKANEFLNPGGLQNIARPLCTCPHLGGSDYT